MTRTPSAMVSARNPDPIKSDAKQAAPAPASRLRRDTRLLCGNLANGGPSEHTTEEADSAAGATAIPWRRSTIDRAVRAVRGCRQFTLMPAAFTSCVLVAI